MGSGEVLGAPRSECAGVATDLNRGLELHVFNVRSEGDFDAVFADIKRLRVHGLVIGAGPVFLRGLDKLADLTVRHAVPAIYSYRIFPAAGGLMRATDWPAYIQAEFSRAKILPNCQSCKQRSLNWSSISRRPRH
jgi:hypothetical protein